MMKNLVWDVDLVRLFVRRGKLKFGPKKTDAQTDNDVRIAEREYQREKKAASRAGKEFRK